MAALVACETKLPTAADIQEMDVSALEQRLELAGILEAKGEGIRYFLSSPTHATGDDPSVRVSVAEISGEAARAIAPESIASIRVDEDAELSRVSEIHITLRGGELNPALASSPESGVQGADSIELAGVEARGYGIEGPVAPGAEAPMPIHNIGKPLFVIDGVPTDVGVFNRLRPDQIESISILKDASAAVYGFRATDGVVLVTTKAAAGRTSREGAEPTEQAPAIRVAPTSQGPSPEPSASNTTARTVYWAPSSVPPSVEVSAAAGNSYQYSIDQALSRIREAGVPGSPVVSIDNGAPRASQADETAAAAEPGYLTSYGVRVVSGTVSAVAGVGDSQMTSPREDAGQ